MTKASTSKRSRACKSTSLPPPPAKKNKAAPAKAASASTSTSTSQQSCGARKPADTSSKKSARGTTSDKAIHVDDNSSSEGSGDNEDANDAGIDADILVEAADEDNEALLGE